jgi:Transposase IS66 family
MLEPDAGPTRTSGSERGAGQQWLAPTRLRDERTWGSQQPPAVWFEYAPGRGGEHPREHLRDFQGVVHCDAYAGFNELFGLFPHRRRNARAGPGRLKRSLCFSHYPESAVIRGVLPRTPGDAASCCSVTPDKVGNWSDGCKIGEYVRFRSPRPSAIGR